ELRSDKPPGQPLLGVPFYLIGRALGAEPATGLRGDGDLGLWWQTLWSSMVPFAALLALMFTMASRFEPRAALPATLAIGFGTMLLPHAAYLYGHTLAALFAFGAWCVLDRSTGRWSLATTGLLAALGVSVEYHTVVIAVVVFGVALLRWQRRAGWLLVGAIPPAIVTAAYQRQAFGHPWRLPYAYYAGKLGAVPTSRGGYSLPTAHSLVDLIAGKHGLLFLNPVVLVGVAAAVIVWRTTPGDVRMHAAVALAVFVPYALLIAGWSGTALLEEPGPRYLIPALPFLVVPLARSWSRLRRVAIVAAAWGAAVMGAGTVTYLFVAPTNAPFRVYFERVVHGEFGTTLWSMAFGRAGAALYVIAVALATLALRRAGNTRTPHLESSAT
ncbi:MAG: hypothetical protein JWL83_2962, partial [Actinomycetia bacterium]|nr:hypothetical protein [Actinomycetes bacterium]